MNWIKNNQYLAGLIGTVVVGAGVLGYLTIDGKGRADDARKQIDRSLKALNSAAKRDEVPVPEVLEAKEAAVAELRIEGEKLHAQAVKRYAFQGDVGPADTFGQRVEARFQELRARWKDSEIVVPEGFFLGFEVYRDRIQANPSAVAELDHQLDSITWLIDKLLQTGVSEIVRFDRQEVAGESGSSAADAGDNYDEVESPLNSYQLVLGVRGTEEEVQKVLNGIVNSKEHLFGVRYVSLANTSLTAPAKAEVESKIESEVQASGGSAGFDFQNFDSFVETDDEVDDSSMSDAERRALGNAAKANEEVEVVADDSLDASGAAEIASLVEDAGRRDAVVFLGAEEVKMTAVLDFIVFKPNSEDSSDQN